MASPSNRGGDFAGSRRGNEMGGTTSPAESGGRSPQGTVAGAVGAAKEKVQEMASSAAAQAERAWESTRRGVQDTASTVASGAGDVYESVSDFISRHPIPMFLAGIGLGFLLARAFEFYPTNMTRRMSEYSAR